MKHATDNALDQLENFLAALRESGHLQERKRGIYYRNSRAFLHFHEAPAGLYVDVRLRSEFERFAVNTKTEQQQILKKIRKSISAEDPNGLS